MSVRRFFLITIASVLLACVIAGATPQTQTHAQSNTISLAAGESVTVTCDGRRLDAFRLSKKTMRLDCAELFPPTATPTMVMPMPTDTSVPPTDIPPTATDTAPTITPPPSLTPTNAPPTNTPAPPATNTPGSGNIAPFASAPLCPTHDENAWHSLWDATRGCHYDHEHGDDPHLADSYFGPPGALWGGQSISYPFATSAMENGMKHGGYKYSVKTPSHNPWSPCGVNDNTDISESGNNCVIASRVEYHAVGGLMDAMARYHSYFIEAYVCKAPQFTACGTIKIGGWADYGQLQAPHYNARVVRPGGTIDFGGGITMDFPADGPDLPSHSGEPYVFMIPYTPEELAWRQQQTKVELPATDDQWSMNDFDCNDAVPAGDPCHNPYARIMAQVSDSWNLVDAANPNHAIFVCRDGKCPYNGSLTGLEEIAFKVLQSWQSGGNGFVTLNGYTDRWGNPKLGGGCTSVSVDCVPFVLDHMPVGVAASRNDNGCECSSEIEHDIFFNGKQSNWIKFPN